MSFTHHSSQITSKYVGTYTKLFQGLPPEQIAPHENSELFYSNLLNLDVKHDYLKGELDHATKDACLGSLKLFLNGLFQACLTHARHTEHGDVKKLHALETLTIIIRYVLAKNLTGWEVMEIFAGGVSQSDAVFMAFTAMVSDILADEAAPATIRYQVLKVALIYMCAIGQLSPGAYFLRRDLFPSIATFIKSLNTTTQYVVEAVLLLAILANFHKSDAARLNPYLRRIKECKDEDLLRKICRASSFALDSAIRAFQSISDDSVKPMFSMSLGSIFAALRPDRALAITPVDPPRELFKNQPIQATVILLPVFEFLHTNPIFSNVLLEHVSLENNPSGLVSPPLFTILTLSSYLLTHASSTMSSRSVAYADLALNILLNLVEDEKVMEDMCHPTDIVIHLCRQRLPLLPIPRPKRSPVCALLDCCVLWLRHNLHKQLEVYSYTNCIWICYRVIWFLQKSHIRLEYEWKELWGALVKLLNFLYTKLDSLNTTGGVEHLVRETIDLLDLALCKSELYLPSPSALHEFIYELVRSSPVLKSQVFLLKSLALPITQTVDVPADNLADVLEITQFYEEKIRQAGAQTAKDAMRVVSKEIEADGLRVTKGSRDVEATWRTEDVLGFSRYACSEGLGMIG